MRIQKVSAAPRIEPLPQASSRPTFSVMIPAYNYAEYMRETLESVLRQDPGPDDMQIEVVDDFSTRDDPETVTREVGRGRVNFTRQPRNLGMIDNFNDCVRRARGEWVHILHGDDCVRPGFYERVRQAAQRHPEIGAWVCRLIYLDADGLWSGLSELDARAPGILGEDFVWREFVTPRIQFAGMVVRRSMFEALGGFRPELKICLDWDMWKRVVLYTKVYYDPEPLSCFRLHARSAYASAVSSGIAIADERKSIEISNAYVPREVAPRLSHEAMKAAAVRAIRLARTRWREGNRPAAFRLAREALRCSTSPEVLARLLWTVPACLAHRPHKGPPVPAKVPTLAKPLSGPNRLIAPGI
jgi:Glycosyl transferase family 2